ncbi:sortase domain-bontaining protein [Streptomyces sp. NPDC015130]|uniref:sortase domain-containing protein n=1 Tax=Streptomyces sp. NPDC015130 TaxID=3364940 RepID=UPI0036F61BDD
MDTATAPAVFARLGELQTGDPFEVARADGTTAVFLVDSVESFRKDDFPNQRVYGGTPDALVRLITCAGRGLHREPCRLRPPATRRLTHPSPAQPSPLAGGCG